MATLTSAPASDTHPELRLIVATDPERLLRHAASGFLVPLRASAGEPFPTVPYLLALRQGGLRDDVIEMAAEARVPGWFDPPLCTFQELPGWLGAPERHTLGDHDRLALLAHLLRDPDHRLFEHADVHDDLVDAVNDLYGELIADGVSPEHFASALAARAGRDAFEAQRDDDLARGYAAYHQALDRLHVGDGRDELLHCARAIENGTAALAQTLGARREIRIVGLNDLRRGWRHLLRALARTPALETLCIYGAPSMDLSELHPVVQRLDESRTLAARLFAQPAERGADAATLIVAPDVDREMDHIACRVRALIDAGTPPHRIAIVSRQERPHVEEALAALARAGVPATARQRINLAEVPAVRAVGTLFDAAAEGWTRHGLCELADQPYLACGLSARVINEIGYRRRVEGLAAWAAALSALEERTGARLAHAGPPNDADEVSVLSDARAELAAARAGFGTFAARAKELDRSRSLLAWLEWLERFLRDDPWGVVRAIYDVPDERFDIARIDLAGWNGLSRIVRDWREAVSQFGAGSEVLSVQAFASQLRACLTGDVALWTPQRRGVAVLEALAAAYRSFDHLFLVGLEAGAFPRAPRASALFDEAERTALAGLGMPFESREVWETRERELFRVLVAGARHLTASYSRLDERGRDVIGSSFVEELRDAVTLDVVAIASSKVLTPGMPLVRSAEALAHAAHAARIERARASRVPSVYAGQIADAELAALLAREFGDDRQWSPTQLEEFAKCPWAYFSKRLLRLSLHEEPSEDIDRSLRGRVLHDALRRFYDSAHERLDAPVFLRAPDEEWAGPLLDACVDAAFDDAAQREWVGHPALRDATRAELRALARGFLAWELDLHEKMFTQTAPNAIAPKMIRTGVDRHELAFHDMVYEHDGVRLRFRGSIDRVEVCVDDRVPDGQFVAAMDYKTSMSATPGDGKKKAWRDHVVLQLPLYAHALRQLYPEHEVARVEYATLKKPQPVHRLQPFRYDRKRGVAVASDADTEQWEAALRAAVAHVRRARSGEFPPVPPPSCNCPPWCQGRDICRIPGGPRDGYGH
ncbi:MAG TPA: PD-(D/E)XK nuclease family protein [Gemmatimonadaceae bacterium]|nr:PD-(D/E)XK nuclease family protein [Gemmatimonadaceae bacterium]